MDRAALVRALTTRSGSNVFAAEMAVACCASRMMVVVLEAQVVLHDGDQRCR